MAHGKNNTVVIHPNSEFQANAHVKSMDEYFALYRDSIEKPDEFWGTIAQEFYWKRPPTGPFSEGNFDLRKGSISIRWMQGAVTNVCYNMLDRNVQKGLGDQVAFFWEGNDPEDTGKMTYSELLRSVCKFSNVLKRLGIKKGDRVAIYMPMIIELTVAMLACARIGAIHSIIFGGFSAESIADRILDAHCSLLVTCDAVWRGVKLIKLKDIVDDSLRLCAERGHTIANCVVVRHLSADQYADTESQPPKRPHFGLRIHWEDGRDLWWHQLMEGAQDECEPEWMDAEEPLFMLYTSGSTGKPKGVLHTCGGYMIYASTTFKYVFDYHPGDVYWCTADVGWITGHSYVCYGPLANGASSVLFEGIPFWPDAGRCWEIIDKYSVSKFYTAPTALRALMKSGDSYVLKHKRTSLKVLGSVGEPINPEAWLWYYKVVGGERSPICDTFWQTETGGHALTPLPGCTPLKPGSATLPFFGIVPALLDEDGHELQGEAEGYLVFKQPWPGIMRTVYGNHQRFEETYFSRFPGYYFTGDGAYRDKDGYYWITGRIDDMINVSGHLMSTAEVESALVEHPAVVEAAVVGKPHAVKGLSVYCFVTLRDGWQFSPTLDKELRDKVRDKIGPIATPDTIQEAPGLPKTRSGKIMRRILRNIAAGIREFGDISTLAEPQVVEQLFELRPPDRPEHL